MWVVALVDYQFLADNTALIGALHHKTPTTDIDCPDGRKVKHSVVYVGCYQPSMPGTRITQADLSTILKNVPSLLGNQNLTFNYKFKICWDGQPYIIEATQQSVTRDLSIQKVYFDRKGTYTNQLPLFYIYSYGLESYAAMLAKISYDYAANPQHVKLIQKNSSLQKISEGDIFALTDLALSFRKAISSEHCYVCQGGRNSLERNSQSALERNFAAEALAQRAMPGSAPPSPQRPSGAAPSARPATAPAGLQRIPFPGQPFTVQDANETTSFLEPKHPHGCCCFKCGCCSIS